MAAADSHPLSLHDALPILQQADHSGACTKVLLIGSECFDGLTRSSKQDIVKQYRIMHAHRMKLMRNGKHDMEDRKSTRLNSSHVEISYAVFCLKKKWSELG